MELRYSGMWAAPGAPGVIGNSDPGTLKDVGLGMRFGNTRSGLGNVLHIDLAFPLSGDHNISKVQFLVQTKANY